jgi:phosphoglycerol transferase MdoB-like AlkP superfamily enzyme
MESTIFSYIFVGFLARGMIGSFINNVVKTDILLFCKPINILGASYFIWALAFSSVDAIHVGFFMSDIIITILMVLNTANLLRGETK